MFAKNGTFDRYQVFRPFAVFFRPNERAGHFLEHKVTVFADVVRRTSPIGINLHGPFWFGPVIRAALHNFLNIPRYLK